MARSSALRGLAGLGLAVLLLGLVLPSVSQEQSQKAPAKRSSQDSKVSPTQEGDSVRFYLPEAWVEKFWKGDSAMKPYVAELPPDKLDKEEDFAPCLPPRRIATGYVDASSAVHEKLAACVNFCDSRPGNKLFYEGLWGRLTRLDRVHVYLKKDGSLDVIFKLKKVGGSEIRVRHLSLAGPREPMPAGEAGSCSAAD